MEPFALRTSALAASQLISVRASQCVWSLLRAARSEDVPSRPRWSWRPRRGGGSGGGGTTKRVWSSSGNSFISSANAKSENDSDTMSSLWPRLRHGRTKSKTLSVPALLMNFIALRFLELQQRRNHKSDTYTWDFERAMLLTLGAAGRASARASR